MQNNVCFQLHNQDNRKSHCNGKCALLQIWPHWAWESYIFYSHLLDVLEDNNCSELSLYLSACLNFRDTPYSDNR